MREITLKVPDDKLPFFMQLMKELNINVSETTDDIEIPEEHKAIVMERIKNSRPEELIPWEEARKKLRFKEK